MLIYLFLAEGFEEIEAIAPIDIFRRAGIDVKTVSISDNKVVTGAHGVSILADTRFDETSFESDSMLFLPGGLPGTTNLAAHAGLAALIEKQAAAGKNLAAICAAPSVFGQLNLLEGKEAVCYPGFENKLTNAVLSTHVKVRSGNIYTGKAAGVAMDFALMIVSDLMGAKVADDIKAGMFIQ